MEESIENISIKVRRNTLQEALNMLNDPSGCYPTLDDAQDFLERNWDLIEALAERATAIGLTPLIAEDDE